MGPYKVNFVHGLVCLCFLSYNRTDFSPYTEVKREQFRTYRIIQYEEVTYLRFLSVYYSGSIKDDLYWISGRNSLELINLSNMNKVSLV